MKAGCIICTHPKRAEIEAGLLLGRSLNFGGEGCSKRKPFGSASEPALSSSLGNGIESSQEHLWQKVS